MKFSQILHDMLLYIVGELIFVSSIDRLRHDEGVSIVASYLTSD